MNPSDPSIAAKLAEPMVYPPVPAAFINAIAEDGTKAEAVEWLQKIWNELQYRFHQAAVDASGGFCPGEWTDWIDVPTVFVGYAGPSPTPAPAPFVFDWNGIEKQWTYAVWDSRSGWWLSNQRPLVDMERTVWRFVDLNGDPTLYKRIERPPFNGYWSASLQIRPDPT